MKTLKLASAGYLDGLPAEGDAGGQASRDLDLGRRLLEALRRIGFGAQFGGKHFVLDARVVRLPRLRFPDAEKKGRGSRLPRPGSCRAYFTL